jgi:hypothetical protein
MRLPDSAVHVALDALASGGPDRQLGLSTTPITVTGGGLTGITEPGAASYDRVDVAAADWDDAADRAAQTSAPVFLPDADEDWGVVVAYFLTDGAGTPQIPFRIGDGGRHVPAGSTAINVRPRITPAHFTA